MATNNSLAWFPSLMYHRVVESVGNSDPYSLCMSVKMLDEQLRFLKNRGYKVTSIEDAIKLAEDSEATDENIVALTFDDGYLDFFIYALPVLQRYEFTATVFLVSNELGGINSWDRGKVDSAPLMGFKEIREVQASGVTFGSHSCTHPLLATLDSATAFREIVDSKSALEQVLGTEVRLFCYPYGNSNSSIQSVVADAGYVAACGIEQREHTVYNVSRIDAVLCHGTGLRWRHHLSGRSFRLRKAAAGVRDKVISRRR
ncbi:MAG: polysaccharide deacetylase family protein [Dehalococcoidia bacterium]